MSVLLETSVGDITVDLYTDERSTCCKNFLKLCKIKYYNFCLFHSVQRNLVAQTGDPTGTGSGGESVYGILYGEQAKYFDAEISPRIKHKKVGTVSMVNNGGNMHGSQFFFTLGEDLDSLDGQHTVFGEVGEGLDVLMKINEAYCDREHRPYKDIRVYHTVILDDPYEDPKGLEVPDRSPEPTKEQLDSGRIGAEEEIDDFKDKTHEQIEAILAEKESKANAQLLTMIGDLPDEDVAPPENVLFVCKLNPVTTDDDLEIIFSRFGTINSCEVIKDQKTGESLQYAFIEFDKESECENAYFKMDNVLIDDRRIHVDFSQSVSKFKWKGKGRGVDVMKDDNEDSFTSQYRIKDNTRKDSYDLIFDDEDIAKGTKKKKKHKREDRESRKPEHKKKQRERRASSSDLEVERKKRKHKHRQDSGDSDSDIEQRTKHKKQKKRHSRSRSPQQEKSRQRRRSDSPYESRKSHRRSPSPGRYRDRRDEDRHGHRDSTKHRSRVDR